MRNDILLDGDNDLLMVGGDFALGQSDQQHVQHILESFKGEYKQSPTTGFGIINYLKREDSVVSEFKRDLKIQLELDGYNQPNIDLSNGFGQLKIDV